jgi:predicted transcriptional regulator
MKTKKKDTTIGVRVDDDLLEVLIKLAEKEDRPLAAMTRRLVCEALKRRGLLK